MRRRMPLLTLAAVVALSGCSDDSDTVGLTEPEACKAVKERLDVEGLERRFGEPDETQDFFGDRVVIYERGEIRWQFQVTAQAGTYRVLQARGKRETVLSCR